MAAENERFARAKNRNLILLLFSVLQIYEPPVQESGVHFYGGPLALTLGIVISILALVHVYDIFMGIKDMAEKAGDLAVAQRQIQSGANTWRFRSQSFSGSSWLLFLHLEPFT